MSYAYHPPAALGRRAVLRSQGHRGPSGLTAPDSTKIAHKVCHRCGRRTYVFLPAHFCGPCIEMVTGESKED